MKNAVALVCTLVILAAGSAFAAQVTNVGLTWQDGYTVARIDVQGAVRFSHQPEPAKDGRPFRVIVDVLAATHQLGQKDFFELPACPVTKIRTSQFAVQPEQVVRLVFDMTRESVYKIASDATGITVSFPDPEGKQFAAWSSKTWLVGQAKPAPPAVAQAPAEARPTMPPPPSHKTTAEVNQSINTDRAASLANPEQAAPPATVAATKTESAPPAPSRVQTPSATPPTAEAPKAVSYTHLTLPTSSE
ncbi:MAG: AMIN domain-containing protein, partial [candidate division Zixibacteria bacterium]|nr:AMIN domain-containing protein [candidate division Zixibacteria bacterium]